MSFLNLFVNYSKYSINFLSQIIKILSFDQIQMGQEESKRQIYITIQAGQTQSQQLFDFHSKDVRVIMTEVINNNAYIAQDGADIVYKNDKKQIDKMLYNINCNSKQIQLESCPKNDKVIWRVLQQQQLFPLEINTIIKIGKVKLKLKKIVQQQQGITRKITRSKLIYRKSQQQLKSLSHLGSNTCQNQCRMCFQSDNTIQNPLISLCKCSGSVKYTHYQCLKQWINNNVVKRQQNNILFFSYQQTKCQICKEYFYPQFTIKGKVYQLLNFSKAPSPPYAIFQEIDQEQDINRYCIFLIGLSEDEITIGRNSSSTIMMKQISVSRNHCSIIYRNNKLFITDKGSKFGTLIKIENEIQFNPINGLKLQLQSKLIKIFEKNSFNYCCKGIQNYRLKVIKKSENGFEKIQELQLIQKDSQII